MVDVSKLSKNWVGRAGNGVGSEGLLDDLGGRVLGVDHGVGDWRVSGRTGGVARVCEGQLGEVQGGAHVQG